MNPEVKVTNWSFEFIVRRNGEAFGEEHQFFGFHSSEPLWGGINCHADKGGQRATY